MKKILIVEDDKPISDLIQMHVSIAGYDTIQMYDAESAYKYLKSQRADLILLDIMLPQMDGIQLLKKINHNQIPVIMLSAKRELTERIKALKMGAEDYIVKPFEPIELLTRIEVVLRRMKSSDKELVFEDVVINESTRLVTKDNMVIQLTPKEYDLICMLIRYQRHALSRDQLLDSVWGYDYYGGTRTVDMHVQRLRKKLEWQNKITTVYKIGYRLEH